MEQYLIPPESFKPEQALKEWQALVLTLRYKTEQLARLSAWSGYDYRATLRAINSIVVSHADAQVFLWNYNVWEAAVRGSDEAFTGLTLDGTDVPARLQYWSLDRDIYLSQEGTEQLGLPPEFAVAGVMLIPTKIVEGKNRNKLGGVTADTEAHGDAHNGFLVAVSYQPGIELTQRLLANEAGGSPVPDEYKMLRLRFWPGVYEGEEVTREYAEYVAGIRFMKLEVVEARPATLPRPVRRREQKEGREIPEIRTVLLRARKSEVGEAELTEAMRREFACHFFVSSHWRKPNRRMKEQRPVFVPAYIKGNLEKPFRPPHSTIYYVNR